MNPPLARVEVERDGDRTRAAIVGEVDLSNAAELEAELEAAAADSKSVLVDLTAVTYLDSRGIRSLVEVARRLQRLGVELVVLAPSDSIAGGALRLVGIPELPLADS